MEVLSCLRKYTQIIFMIRISITGRTVYMFLNEQIVKHVKCTCRYVDSWTDCFIFSPKKRTYVAHGNGL